LTFPERAALALFIKQKPTQLFHEGMFSQMVDENKEKSFASLLQKGPCLMDAEVLDGLPAVPFLFFLIIVSR